MQHEELAGQGGGSSFTPSNVEPSNKEFDGEENSRKKRKAETSPVWLTEMDGKREEIKQAVVKVSEAISVMSKIVVESSKSRTKKDIRDKMEELQMLNKTSLELVLNFLGNPLSEQLQGKLLTFDESNVPPLPPVESQQADRPVLVSGKKYFCEKCSKEIEMVEEEIKAIKENIKIAGALEEAKFLEFINTKWPEEVFEKTKLVNGNPVNIKEGDLFLLCEHKKEESVLLTNVKARYPEIEDILEETAEADDRIQYLENKVTTSKGTTKRRVYVTETKGEKDHRKILEKFREEIRSRGITEVAVAVSTLDSRVLIRKHLEVVFGEEDIKIDFYIPKVDRGRGGNISMDTKGKTTEAVVIKTNVSTYAETMRNIRAVVNPDEIGVDIKAIKVTKDNRVVIVTDKGMGETLHREIAAKVKGTETRVTGNNKTLLILDIDASMSGKEIEECIRKSTRIYETQVRSVKTARSGTQVATVSMPTGAANCLLEEGDIRIGWTRCRVKVKTDIVRCFNCLHVGHHSDICKEEVKEKRCLRCTKPGHLSKDCQGDSYCTSCEKTGHRNDSINCPTYKRILRGLEKVAKARMETEGNNLEKNKDEEKENEENIMIVDETTFG